MTSATENTTARGRAGIGDYLRLPLPIEAVYLMAPVFAVVVGALLAPIKPYDYFWALAQGRLTWQLHANPAHNHFLYTLPTEAPYFNQPWLAELCLYGVATWLCHAANLVLLAAALALAMLAILDTGLRLGLSPRRVAIAAMLASPLLVIAAGVRTQLFAFPCVALAVRLLFTPGWNRRRFSWLMLAAMAHANLHGSFVLLPVLASVAMLTKRELRPWARAATVAALVAATCVHPGGAYVYAYAGSLSRAMGLFGGSGVDEWRPLQLASPLGAAFLLGLLALATITVRAKKTASWPMLAAVSGLAAATVVSLRFLPFATLLAPLALPRARAAVGAAVVSRGEGRLHAVFLLAFVVVVVASLPGAPLARALARGRSAVDPAFSQSVPLRLAGALAQAQPNRIFHTQAVGGLLEWALCARGPAPVAFVDQRFELVSSRIWREYSDGCAGRSGFARLAAKYGIDAVLADADQGGPLLDALAADAQWSLVDSEGRFRLYLRRGGSGSGRSFGESPGWQASGSIAESAGH